MAALLSHLVTFFGSLSEVRKIFESPQICFIYLGNCPIEAGETFVYNIEMFIEPIFPSVSIIFLV